MKEADSERLAADLPRSPRRKRLQIDIDDRTIRSPIDGVVVALSSLRANMWRKAKGSPA